MRHRDTAAAAGRFCGRLEAPIESSIERLLTAVSTIYMLLLITVTKLPETQALVKSV